MIEIERIREVKMPERGTVNSAGIDLFIPDEFPKSVIFSNGSILIPMGIKVNIPSGTMLVIENKSGIASKKSLIVGAKVIDSDYHGEIMVNLHNIGMKDQILTPGMKIVQMLHQPILLGEIYEGTNIHKYIRSERGEGGFGSTGE